MTARQQSLDFGRTLKEAGMKRSLATAERVNPGWGEKCFAWLKVFIADQEGPFKVEAFREWGKNVIPSPPSLRAFGPIVSRAKKEGLIKHVGYTQVENPKAHRATSSLWQRV